MEFRRLPMKTILSTAALAIFFCAQTAPGQSSSQAPPQVAPSAKPLTDSSHADAYYYFTIGHLQEQQYEINSNGDLATESIESYKKALAIEPDSAVIMERLAEIYAKSQRIRDAVLEAQEALKIDPDDGDAHRLLARIYVRTLGDMSA